MNPRQVLARLRARHGPQDGWWPIDHAWHVAHGTDPRMEVCLGAILTQNTSWRNVERALANLKRRRLVDAAALDAAAPATVRAAVRPAGTYNQKTRYVAAFARAVVRDPRGLDGLLGGPVPAARARLLDLPGIGPETADAILLYAGRQPTFVIDAYTRRITRRLALGTGREPYGDLQALWAAGTPRTVAALAEAHALLVEHAKTTCTARVPRCGGCVLAAPCPHPAGAPERHP